MSLNKHLNFLSGCHPQDQGEPDSFFQPKCSKPDTLWTFSCEAHGPWHLVACMHTHTRWWQRLVVTRVIYSYIVVVVQPWWVLAFWIWSRFEFKQGTVYACFAVFAVLWGGIGTAVTRFRSSRQRRSPIFGWPLPHLVSPPCSIFRLWGQTRILFHLQVQLHTKCSF